MVPGYGQPDRFRRSDVRHLKDRMSLPEQTVRKNEDVLGISLYGRMVVSRRFGAAGLCAVSPRQGSSTWTFN